MHILLLVLIPILILIRYSILYPTPYYTILYHTILFYTLLYSTPLYSTLLHSTLLHSTLLYYTILYWVSLRAASLLQLLDVTLEEVHCLVHEGAGALEGGDLSGPGLGCTLFRLSTLELDERRHGYYRGLNNYINRRISHSGSRDQYDLKEIPEIVFCRILMLMWSFGALY